MKLLYDAGIKAYGAAIRLGGLHSAKARDLSRGRASSLSQLRRLTAEKAPGGFDFWFHAASLGEFEQARPLIEKIRAEQPGAKLLLTFFSPSGYNVRRNYSAVDAVCYLPEDTRRNAREFLDTARPRCAVFVKYEFWLNFLSELRRKDIPTYLISAIFRPGQIFFRPWGSAFRECLKTFRTIYVQDSDSERLLAGIGIDRVRVTGDTRFDRVTDIMNGGTRFAGIEDWRGDSFTLIAGSSWPRDEERYLQWVDAHPEVKVIIAPHEFDAERIARLQRRLARPSVLWTETHPDRAGGIPSDAQTLIVNTFGKLSSLYRYADTVIVGGGFGAGIHNINEAAVYGVPVIFGPNNRKFKEAADLKALGGGFEVRDAAGFNAVLDRLYADADERRRAARAAGEYISSNLGATDLIYNDLMRDTSQNTKR